MCGESLVPEFTAWRIGAGLSRELFARCASRRGERITRDVVRSWERGVTSPKPAHCALIAQVSGESLQVVAAWFDLQPEQTARRA